MSEEQLEEILVEFALAVWKAQGIEQNLITLLLMRERSESELSSEDYAEREKLWSRRNLGNLLASVQQKFGQSQRTSGVLEEARESRNMLVHRFFYDNAERLAEPSCHPSLLNELHAARDLLARTEQELLSILGDALRSTFPSPSDYDKLVTQTMDQLRSKFKKGNSE